VDARKLGKTGRQHVPLPDPDDSRVPAELQRDGQIVEEVIEQDLLDRGTSATLTEAIAVARGKAYVILDGTLLRIDRVGMTGGRDRPYYSANTSATGSTCRSSPTRRAG